MAVSISFPHLSPSAAGRPMRRKNARLAGLGAASVLALTLALSSTPARALDVANQTDWNTAVAAVAAAGAGSTVAINFTGGFTLTSSLAQLQATNTNVTVNITGNNQTVNGASAFQGISVSGTNALAVNISNLALTNTLATGGTGGAGQNGFFSGGLSYGSGGGGGGGLGAGGGLFVGSGASVTISAVTFTGAAARGGVGGNGGVAQNTASSPTGGNGGDGGAVNGGAAVGGGAAGGLGGNTGTQGTAGTAGATTGAGGGGGGGSGTTSSTAYTPNNNGGAGNAGAGNGSQGGDGVTNNNGSQGPGSDGGNGGNGGGARGGAIYVSNGGTLTIIDSAVSGSAVTGGTGGSQGVGQGPSSFSGSPGGSGAAQGAGMFLDGVTANIGVSGGTVSYTDIIAGTGGLAKQGAGTLALNSANTYTGGTSVNGGKLVVGDSTHPGASLTSIVTVNNGGTLGGIGTVKGIVANSGGIVGPGNSIGTLNVAGNVSFTTGSIYQVEINSAGQSDKIAATGTATLTGGTVSVVIAPGTYTIGTRYTILTANGGVTGTFSGLVQDLPFLGLALSYDPKDAFLTVLRNQVLFPSVAQTRNQIASATAIQALGTGNAIYDAVVQQTTIANAQAAFDALSGEAHASAKGVLIEDSRFLRDAALNRTRSAFSGVGASTAPVVVYGRDGKPVETAATTAGAAFWGQAFGSWGSSDGDGNAARISRSTGGFFLGGDLPAFDTFRVGLLGGYSRTSFDVKGRASSGNSDNYHVGLYGGTQLGGFGVRGGAAYTWHDVSMTRSPAFAGFSDRLTSSYNAGTAQVFGDVGYRLNAGQFAFEPFANLAYVSLSTDSFAERGGVAALNSRSSTTGVTFSTLGLRGSTNLTFGGFDVTVRGTLGWRHAFGDTTPLSNFSFSGGNAFTVAGVPIAKDAAVVEAGLDWAISKNASLGISYNGQFSGDTRDQSIKGNFAWKF